MIEPWLDAAATTLGLTLTRAQSQALLGYLALLQRWNATYNLTAVRELEAMRVQHIADCLTVIPPLRQHFTAGRLLDVGSGGGLPGVVIAILMPEVAVECVDAVAKKAAFVRQVSATLGLDNLRSSHARVEAIQHADFDVVTSRAFATLADFVRLTRAAVAPRGVWMSMKGQVPTDEMEALPRDVEVFHVEPLAVPGLDAQRCLVWMRPRPGGPQN